MLQFSWVFFVFEVLFYLGVWRKVGIRNSFEALTFFSFLCILLLCWWHGKKWMVFKPIFLLSGFIRLILLLCVYLHLLFIMSHAPGAGFICSTCQPAVQLKTNVLQLMPPLPTHRTLLKYFFLLSVHIIADHYIQKLFVTDWTSPCLTWTWVVLPTIISCNISSGWQQTQRPHTNQTQRPWSSRTSRLHLN